MTKIVAESFWIVLPKLIENLSLDQAHIWSDFSHQGDIKITSNSKKKNKEFCSHRATEPSKCSSMVI